MAQAASFERFFEPAPTNDDPREVQEIPSWRSWEAWLTLALVVLVQLPVVGSLQSSDWVSEMPSLMAPAAAGLAVAWALGHSRVSGAVAALAGLAAGVLVTIALVLHTMRLADPEATGLLARWADFRLRLLEWGRALLSEGISVDPLPFVVLLVASVFLVGFLSTWAVVRWRNPWVALVPGGFVLLTNISYLPGQPSFSFILFILAAVLLVTRLTFMQALLRWRRRGVRPTDGMSIEVLGVGVVVALVLIAAAWTIPTANNWGPVSDAWTRALAPVTTRVDQLGQLFVGVGSKKPIPIHSFGAALPLQGKVVLDREVLYHVVAAEEMNLRGAVYDTYTGAGWRLSSAAAATLLGTTIEAAELGTPATRAQLRETTRAEVTVVSDGAPVNALLTGGEPLATDVNARLLLDATDRPITLVPDGSPDAYITVGTVSAAAIDTLREAGTDYPDALFARYTTLPGDLPSDVRALTETIVAGAETPYDAARLVETHLRQNYAFEYEIQAAPPGRDAVDYFLFESHHGYFDQFATAMAVMLRSVGIPARVAAGFALDDRDLDAATKAYTVTEERAWAWPEVYFPDLGWVEFNPTPARGVVARPGDDSAARDAAAGTPAGDLLDLAFEDQLLAEILEGELDAMLSGERGAVAEEGGGVQEMLSRIVGWLLVASTALLVLVVAVRIWWERLFRGLRPAEKRWAKVQRFAWWAGILPLDDRTPAEAADDLASRIDEPAALRALARAYTRARYGGPDAEDETEDEATALDEHYRVVRSALQGLAARRLLRLGRTVGGPLPRRHTAARVGR